MKQMMSKFRRIAPRPSPEGAAQEPVAESFTEPERKKRRYASSSSSGSSKTVKRSRLELDLNKPLRLPRVDADSWVTVKRVTDACMDPTKTLTCTDIDIYRKLGVDTCPVFVSDCESRVVWHNAAYQKMVVAGGIRPNLKEEDVTLNINMTVTHSLTIPLLSPAFTCLVTVRHSLQNNRRSMVLLCDVFTINAGGFAWRLDLNTALSL